MQKAKKELIASPNALSINNGTKRSYRSKIKINQKHWVYATGTCSLPCWWVTGLRNLFRFSRKSMNRLQLNCPSTVSAPIVSLGLFIFFKEEKQRVALFLCQAKREHSRLAPQELCPPRVGYFWASPLHAWHSGGARLRLYGIFLRLFPLQTSHHSVA